MQSTGLTYICRFQNYQGCTRYWGRQQMCCYGKLGLISIGSYFSNTGPPELSPRIVNTSGYIAFLFQFVVKGRVCSLIIPSPFVDYLCDYIIYFLLNLEMFIIIKWEPIFVRDRSVKGQNLLDYWLLIFEKLTDFTRPCHEENFRRQEYLVGYSPIHPIGLVNSGVGITGWFTS